MSLSTSCFSASFSAVFQKQLLKDHIPLIISHDASYEKTCKRPIYLPKKNMSEMHKEVDKRLSCTALFLPKAI